MFDEPLEVLWIQHCQVLVRVVRGFCHEIPRENDDSSLALDNSLELAAAHICNCDVFWESREFSHVELWWHVCKDLPLLLQAGNHGLRFTLRAKDVGINDRGVERIGATKRD